jgi:hypothetical protein
MSMLSMLDECAKGILSMLLMFRCPKIIFRLFKFAKGAAEGTRRKKRGVYGVYRYGIY